MNEKDYQLLFDCAMQLDDSAELIKHYVSAKHPDKTVSSTALDLIKERRRMTNLSNKIVRHLQESATTP